MYAKIRDYNHETQIGFAVNKNEAFDFHLPEFLNDSNIKSGDFIYYTKDQDIKTIYNVVYKENFRLKKNLLGFFISFFILGYTFYHIFQNFNPLGSYVSGFNKLLSVLMVITLLSTLIFALGTLIYSVLLIQRK